MRPSAFEQAALVDDGDGDVQPPAGVLVAAAMSVWV